MSTIEIKKAVGLNTQPNELDVAPGSLTVAENVEITRDGVIEVARGFEDFSTNLPDFRPEQLFVFDGVAYAHLDDGIWYNTGSGWARKGGSSQRSIGTAAGIWVDSTEANAYICGQSDHAVYKFNFATGRLTVLAGLPGTSGTANGTGTVARFDTPTGIWGDGTNLYVCDKTNVAIRKIVISNGVVTTFAGLIGTAAHTDHATGTSARFESPHGIWGDSTNLYVTEKAHGYVRKIVIGGTQTVTTLTSGLTTPQGIWGTGSTLYVVTDGTTIVRTINTGTGVASQFATGLAGDGAGTTLAHSEGTYLWVGSLDGASPVYRVTLSDAAVNNTPFAATTDATIGVWAFTGKIWTTGTTNWLKVGYPSTGGSLVHLVDNNASTSVSNGSLMLAVIEGPA